jgi:hypothetical protein
MQLKKGHFLSMLHVLANVLTDLQGGSMHLYDVVGLIRPPNFEEFRIYLQQVEVYGGGYKDDISYHRANLRND